MVAKRIKNPHPLNKRCNRCRRCRFKTLYGIASLSRKLFKVTRLPFPETDIQETVFLDQPCFPLPPATNPDTETVLIAQPRLLLPPATNPDTKTVFLDLDATLICAHLEMPQKYDYMVSFVNHKGKTEEYYVMKRPGVDEFLDFLAKKKFEVVLFTSGMKEYASAIVEKLDQNKVISRCLYRDSCRKVDGSYVKDLSETGRNLENVIIVDDNPRVTRLQPKNAYLIPQFRDDLEDQELRKLMDFFEDYDGFDDFREAIRDFLLSQNESGGSGSSSPDTANTIEEDDDYEDLQKAIRDFVFSENEARGSGSSPPDAANTIDDKASSSKSSGT